MDNSKILMETMLEQQAAILKLFENFKQQKSTITEKRNTKVASSIPQEDLHVTSDLTEILRVRVIYSFTEKGKKMVLTYPIMDLRVSRDTLPTVSIERIEDGLGPYKTIYAGSIDKLPTENVAEIRADFYNWIVTNV